jgi:prepilin-type N-terminal cleavage/methylation domain-containing protein/prepilin-type processing-associated H-X9-DG protein
MTAESERDPEFDVIPSKSAAARGFTIIEVLVVLGVIVVLTALLLPCPPWTGKMCVARHAQCVNNLKQIALALHQYEQEYDALPPAYTADADGRPLHSWRTLILPYLEQTRLYESIDLTKPWNDPANARALAASVPSYHCPSSSGEPNATTYLAIVAPGGCFDPTRPRRLLDITDAHESTLMVIEVGAEHAVPWMAPADADETKVMSLGSAAKPPHGGGRNVSFVDGGVRFLKADISAETLRALISISGGDDVRPDAS